MDRRASSNYHGNHSGFTLVELVVVIVLLGILTAYVTPRLNISGFQQQGYYQQAVAALRYAQKQAVAANCAVTATFTPTSCTVAKSGCTGSPVVLNPATGLNEFCPDSAAGGSVTGGPIVFDNIGALSSGGPLVIKGISIIINANTGFIQAP